MEAEFVIVGLGAAGCLLYSKLAEAGFSVIGIETGENRYDDAIIHDSLYAQIGYGLEENALPAYLYQRIPANNNSLQPDSKNGAQVGRGIGNRLVVPGFNGAPNTATGPSTVGIYSTGRVLGGGSSINGEQYVRGSDAFWKLMYDVGGRKWSPHAILDTYIELEKYNGSTPTPAYHGYSGELNIRQAPVVPTQLAVDVATALSKATGIPAVPQSDYNNPATPVGPFTKWQLFQYPNSTRASSDISFLPTVLHHQGNVGLATAGGHGLRRANITTT